MVVAALARLRAAGPPRAAVKKECCSAASAPMRRAASRCNRSCSKLCSAGLSAWTAAGSASAPLPCDSQRRNASGSCWLRVSTRACGSCSNGVGSSSSRQTNVTPHTSIEGRSCTCPLRASSAEANSGERYRGSAAAGSACSSVSAGRSSSTASSFHPLGKRMTWRGEWLPSTQPQRWSVATMPSSEPTASRTSGTLGRRPTSRESRASCSIVKRPSSSTR